MKTDGHGKAARSQERQAEKKRGQEDVRSRPEFRRSGHAGIVEMSQQKQPSDDKLARPRAEAIHKSLEEEAAKKKFLGNRDRGHGSDAGDKERDSRRPDLPAYGDDAGQEEGRDRHQERARGHTEAKLA